MDTNMVLNASFNELVFENRHKNYGAYQIRKRYSRNVLLAGFLAVSFFSAALGTYFINMPESQAGVPVITGRTDTISVIIGDHPPVKPPVKPVVTPPAAKGSAAITSNIIVAKDSVAPINKTDSIGSATGVTGGTGTKDSVITGIGSKPCLDCPDTTEKIVKRRNWLPFPPKDPGLDAFFVKNIKYPQPAKDQGIEGTVYLTFVVDTKGDVREIKIAKGAHPLLDREVLRVAKFMPKWEPVKDETGEIIEYQYSKPVRFKLQ